MLGRAFQVEGGWAAEGGQNHAESVDVWRCDALEAAFWEALSELPMHEFLHDVDENEVCAPNSNLHIESTPRSLLPSHLPL